MQIKKILENNYFNGTIYISVRTNRTERDKNQSAIKLRKDELYEKDIFKIPITEECKKTKQITKEGKTYDQKDSK